LLLLFGFPKAAATPLEEEEEDAKQTDDEGRDEDFETVADDVARRSMYLFYMIYIYISRARV